MTIPIRSQAELLDKVEARARGLMFYFTGKACKHGHTCPRYVSTGICFECSAMHKRLAWKRNPDAMRARERARIAADPQANRDRVRAWRKRNPEKKRAAARRHGKKNFEQKKAYRVANKERLSAYYRDRYAKNKEGHKAHARNRKARLRSAIGKHSGADIQRIFLAQKGRCAYCRIKLGAERHVDHIKPLSKGGSNWPSNLQITCAPCNLSKLAADPIDFAQRIGMLL